MTPPGRLLESITERRSARRFAGSAPSAAELAAILRAGTTVPDHGELRPYRFVVVTNDARRQFGDALATAAEAMELDTGDADAHIDRDRYVRKAFVAPTLVAVVASPRPHAKVQQWEQRATAACAGYALVLAAHAVGLGAVWKSVPFTRGDSLVALLQLGPAEELLGWINLGRAEAVAAPRARLPLAHFVAVLGADGALTRYATVPTTRWGVGTA